MTQHPLIQRLLCAALLLLSCVSAQADSQRLQEAIVNPARSDTDRQRDLRDKPMEVLALLNLQQGMQVADVFAGGGYYSELLSYLVGASGRVLMRNNRPYAEYAKKDWQPRLANQRLANVDNAIVDNTELQLPVDALDAALLMMTFHDLYYEESKHNWQKIDVEQFLGQLFTALKPGGLLLITDHAARDGEEATQAQTLHRIEERYAQQQIERSGFELIGASEVLRNPQDQRQQMVFDAAIRGKTDRFVHLYRKPKRPVTANRFYY